MVTKMNIFWCYTLYDFLHTLYFYAYIGIYDIHEI